MVHLIFLGLLLLCSLYCQVLWRDLFYRVKTLSEMFIGSLGFQDAWQDLRILLLFYGKVFPMGSSSREKGDMAPGSEATEWKEQGLSVVTPGRALLSLSVKRRGRLSKFFNYLSIVHFIIKLHSHSLPPFVLSLKKYCRTPIGVSQPQPSTQGTVHPFNLSLFSFRFFLNMLQ